MEKIALIDLDSIVFSAFHGKKVVDPNTGDPAMADGKFVIVPKTDDEIKESLDFYIQKIFENGQFTHYIIFVKGHNTIEDRIKANPAYKQQRNKETPEKWEFTKQYAIEKWGAIQIDGIEVDDAIRICSLNIANSHIVAIDKDLLWLKGTNFNWRKNEWSTVTKEQEEEYLAISLIVGKAVAHLKSV